MGYTSITWDNWSGTEKQPDSVFKKWADLTDEERSAVIVLGYTRGRWDNKSPASNTKYWSQLSDLEKEAAETFGYNEKTWDNLSGEEKSPMSSSTAWDDLKALFYRGKMGRDHCLR